MALEKSEPAKRGRPRRLQLEQVLEAALSVGLHQLTMAAVAERLGVAKAVLYGYVESRDELVQLAAAQASRRYSFPEDVGQPWSAWVLQYARALFEVMTMDGQMLEAWLGGQSPLVEVDAAEMWLRALTKRGFSGEKALQLRHAVSQLVIGAAATTRHDRVLRSDGRPRPVSARKAVFSRPVEETALLREFVDVFAQETTEQSWEFSLYLLLRGVMVSPDALDLHGGEPRDMFNEKPLHA